MKKIIPLLALLLLLSMTFAMADGCFFVPPGYYDDVTEPTQKAIIIHDGLVQQLMLQVSYGGEADNFAWVVPFPEIPKINTTNPYIFEEAYQLTASEYKSAPNLISNRGMKSGMSFDIAQEVQVLDQQQLDVYEATTLAASDANALEKWLADNNYAVPPNTNEVLQPYIDNQWYFVAFKINMKGFVAEFFPVLQEAGYAVSSTQEFITAMTDVATTSVVNNQAYTTLTPILEQIDLENYYEILPQNKYNKQIKEYHGYPDVEVRAQMRRDITQVIEDTYYTRINTYCGGNNDIVCEKQSVIPGDTAYDIVRNNCGISCKDIQESESIRIDDASEIVYKAYLKNDAQAVAFVGPVTKREQDDIEDYRRRIKYQSEDKVEFEVRERLEAVALQEIMPYLSSGANYGAISTVLTEDIFSDIANDVEYSQSLANEIPFITSFQYGNWMRIHTGRHDEKLVRKEFQDHIEMSLAQKERSTQQGLQRGTLKSLHFTFNTTIPVYPLRISALNNGESEILLYIFAKNKMAIASMDGFTLERARQLTQKDLNESARIGMRGWYLYEPSPNQNIPLSLQNYLTDELYVTKYRAVMSGEDMTSDVYFQQAPDNEEFRIVKKENNFLLKWILAIIGIVVAIGCMYGLNVGIFMLIALLWNHITHTRWNVKYKKMLFYGIPISAIIVSAPIIDHFSRSNKWINFWDKFLDPFRFIFEKLDYFLPDAIAAVLVFVIFVIFWFVVFRIIDRYIFEKRKPKPKKINEQEYMPPQNGQQ